MKQFFQLGCIFFIVLPFFVNAQEKGIKYESGYSWKEIQAKAKAEKKPIFVDCYATWCGPCKAMDREILSKNDIGNYFNSHFINVKVQMDKTSGDAEAIRNWYRDATELMEKYEIKAFPTYLFFSSDGQIVHKIIGVANSKEDFLAKTYRALTPETQYFPLVENLNKHDKDSSYLMRALLAARDADDVKSENKIAKSYIESVKQPITLFNIQKINPLTNTETDFGFLFYLHHAAEIDQVMGKNNFVESKLAGIIFKEEIAPLFFQKNISFNWKKTSYGILSKYTMMQKGLLESALNINFKSAIRQEINISVGEDLQKGIEVDWNLLGQKLKNKYVGYDCKQILYALQTQYYWDRKLWSECARVAFFTMDDPVGDLGNLGVNNICWEVIFLHLTDKKVLAAAIRQMERVVKSRPEDCEYADTYANLLYKMGHPVEAMEWEKKAIDLAKISNVDDKRFRVSLEKMQKGKSTWDKPGQSS